MASGVQFAHNGWLGFWEAVLSSMNNQIITNISSTASGGNSRVHQMEGESIILIACKMGWKG